MFQEAIGKLTSEHLRTHLDTYLTQIEQLFTGSDKLNLVVPTVSDKLFVGGIVQVDIDELPMVGVDCVEKQEIPNNESLVLYQYTGAITGFVRGQDASIVDRLAKRYNRAIELFVKRHQLLRSPADPPLSTDFLIREFLYTSTNFSGSIELELEKETRVWVAGFTCNVAWFVSEDWYSQH